MEIDLHSVPLDAELKLEFDAPTPTDVDARLVFYYKDTKLEHFRAISLIELYDFFAEYANPSSLKCGHSKSNDTHIGLKASGSLVNTFVGGYLSYIRQFDQLSEFRFTDETSVCIMLLSKIGSLYQMVGAYLHSSYSICPSCDIHRRRKFWEGELGEEEEKERIPTSPCPCLDKPVLLMHNCPLCIRNLVDSKSASLRRTRDLENSAGGEQCRFRQVVTLIGGVI